MAATNPFRVKDLIRKYGWEILPYLSNLGSSVLAETQVLFVDSGHTDALDADDARHGHLPTLPLATWDYAVGLCTASEGSVIILLPGHNENLGAAQIDIDILGVHTIGVGRGSLKPRIDFDDAASSIDIGADDVTIQNVNLLPSTGSVLIGVHVETNVTGFKMKDVEFMIGEDGSGADEFVKAVEMTSGNDDCVFEDVRILAHDSAAQATHGIHVAAAADRTSWKNVIIDGPYATGGIVEAAAGVNLACEGCSIDVSGTNFSFDGSSTFAKRTNNVDAGVDSEEDEALTTVVRGTGDYPTGITDNSILAYVLGKGSTASASTFVNTTDSLEAISDAVGAIGSLTDVTAAVPDTPTSKSLQDILSKLDGVNTFDKATDSLEAIADFVRTGIIFGSGIQLDHLLKTSTGVAMDGDLSTFIANLSVMAHIMSKTAVGSSFDASTDSLEAISDALLAGTGCTAAIDADQLDHLVGTTTSVAAGADLETYCVAGSLMAHVLSVGADVTSFDCRTDSLEVISDKLGAYTFDGGADEEDTIMSHLDMILADTAAIDPGAKRLVTTILTDWALSATNALWTVSGMVRARIWGEVLVPVANVATNIKLSGIPTAPGGAIDICANLDCDADAAGTIYKMATTLGGAMQEVTGGVCFDDGIEVILPAGTVVMGSGANEAGGGSIQWFCRYEPLEAGAAITAT